MFKSICLIAVCAALVGGCGFPGAPAHSSVTFSTAVMEVATVASYSCERGFELLGPSRRVCQANGTWAPPSIPFCVINVAFGKAPMQSSTAQEGIPQKAVDGSTTALFDPQTCTLTQSERRPLWYVNLLEPYMVQLVRLDFGRSCCENNTPANMVVRVGNNRPDLETNPICNRYTGFVEEGRPLFLPCNPAMPGAFVSVHLEAPMPQRLSICEAFVYTDQALPAERCPHFRDLPPGSIATYNGNCYSFYRLQPKSFARARAFCRERGGSLIAETSPALQGFLSWELWRRHRSEPDGQYWLGAMRDSRRANSWRWLHGADVAVSFWAVTGGGGGDCARMDATKDWLWASSDCGRRINFVCQHEPLTCGRPEQPPNSTLTAVDFGVGARIMYHCQPGHLLVGPEERQCLPTGFYSAYPPTCKRLQCGLPAAVLSGHYALQDGSRAYLSTVEYRCHQGYTLVGRSTLICDVDERWNGPPPRCQPVTCGAAPSVLNGAYRSITNSTAVGALLEYYCLDERFTLVGAKFLRCRIDGKYDQEAPICRATDNVLTTDGTTDTIDLSFLDDALAASASEIVRQQVIDLGGLAPHGVSLWDELVGARGGGDITQGGAGDHEGAGDELDSAVAAGRLAAVTDISSAYRPTEGQTADHVSFQTRPVGDSEPVDAQGEGNPALTPVHRLGRPQGGSGRLREGAANGGRDDRLPTWPRQTSRQPEPPAWSGHPPRLTVPLANTAGAAVAPAASVLYDRSRPRPGLILAAGRWPVAQPPAPSGPASAPADQQDATAAPVRRHPNHRPRYRPVTPPAGPDAPAGVHRHRPQPVERADVGTSAPSGRRRHPGAVRQRVDITPRSTPAQPDLWPNGDGDASRDTATDPAALSPFSSVRLRARTTTSTAQHPTRLRPHISTSTPEPGHPARLRPRPSTVTVEPDAPKPADAPSPSSPPATEPWEPARTAVSEPAPSRATPVTAAAPASTAATEPAGYDRPEDSRTPDTVLIRANTPPDVPLPDVEPDVRQAGPRLNLSGIIALGVFGGFVFLSAVLTTIVLIVRRSRVKPRRHGHRHYISSSYSTDSETRGLSKRSRRGWAGRPPPGHPSPRSRLSGSGYRDAGEVAVADVAHVYRGDEKRRQHHHHHHRHHHGEDRPRRH